jgi:hypothetical protein
MEMGASFTHCLGPAKPTLCKSSELAQVPLRRGASDKSVLSSQRGNAGVDVIAVWIRRLSVTLGDRPLQVAAIAMGGKEKGSCKVSVAQA